jgi:hypothetical protein
MGIGQALSRKSAEEWIESNADVTERALKLKEEEAAKEDWSVRRARHLSWK